MHPSASCHPLPSLLYQSVKSDFCAYNTIKEYNAVFSFDGDVTDGDMPRKQRKIIAAWAEIHKDELLANWELAMNEQPLYKIEPLR